MVEPFSIGIGIGLLIKSAPQWCSTLEKTLFDKGKETAGAKIKEYAQAYVDKKNLLRHMELVLQNAAERGLKQWHNESDRDRYRNLLKFLAETQSDMFRLEAMQHFTLSDTPNIALLEEKYNLSRRISDLAQHKEHAEIDAVPYLESFFNALLAELYNDPLFREQMSDVIKVRAALQGQRTLNDILETLYIIKDLQTHTYSPEQLRRDLDIYMRYIEDKYHQHKFAGIVFPGEEDKAPDVDGIFIPLRIGLQQRSSQRDDNNNGLVSLLEQQRYLVLLGGPGSGKSMTTCYLAWSHTKAYLTDSALSSNEASKAMEIISTRPVPLRIELRLLSEARRQNLEYSFLSYATKVLLARENKYISIEMFEALLERRGMVLLFDGLDEVPTLSERRQLVEEIESFARQFPGNYILVTSRPVGYELATFTDSAFLHANVQDFDDEQIHQFLVSWYTHVLKYNTLPYETQKELEAFYVTVKENPRLHKLAVNPLLLTVMTALHRYERLPDERVLVYEKCAELLLDTWSRLKHEGVRWKEMRLNKEGQKACMAHLGFILHKRSQDIASENVSDSEDSGRTELDAAVDVPAPFIRRVIMDFLAEQNLLSKLDQAREADLFLEMVRTEAGLLVSRGTDETGEALYGFVHRTFQEFFAALDVINRYNEVGDAQVIGSFLAEHIHDPHWNEVIMLLLGKLNHKFVKVQLSLILKNGTHRSSYNDLVKQDLFFIGTCMTEGITLEKDFARDITTNIAKVVDESPFPTQRQEALGILVLLTQTRQYADMGKEALQGFMERKNLPLSQQIQLARALYQSSPAGSEEEKAGAQYLLSLLHNTPSLSLDQQIQIAQALYQYSPDGSEERKAGVQFLLSLLHNTPSLSLDQQIQLTQALYQYTGTPEAFQRLCLYIKTSDITQERKQELLSLPLRRDRNNFSERLQSIQMLCDLLPKEAVTDFIRAQWEEMPFTERERDRRESIRRSALQENQLTGQEKEIVAGAPFIYALASLDVLPEECRDEMYLALKEMTSLIK